ncbi:WecB/TagA/CpsF family glycosyltransferase [Henriciella sp. AS95]|uniref:WecB/TagA/CpsF family glycosyltransferase n=1 Tax=Henriciella sp. AS95 TaxID=3135782 RepID=UPI0031772B15
MSLPQTARVVQQIQPVAARPSFSPFEQLPRTSVLGYDLLNATLAQTAYWIANRAQARIPTQISFLNAHCANQARKDWRYRDSLQSADALLPDGSGIFLAAKLDQKPLGENLNGTDLFTPLCRCLAFRGIPVFFLGGREGVAAAAAENAVAQSPRLKVAGTRHGYFSPREEEDVIRQINESGARVVFVAFGVPDQDNWIARVRHRINAPVLLGVGGLLDFVSGRIPRAPVWMRKAGIEWVYRLKCEPSRMWRRYLVGNVSFVSHAVGYALARRKRALVRGVDRTAARAIDVTAAALGIAFLLPLLLTVAAAIRLDSKGPALFRQTRIGENGKPFDMFKFRSMRTSGPSWEELQKTANDHADSITFKMKRDPRITRVGQFIRKSSIDELPQLWNVLKGDMSLVGPRPALPAEVDQYSTVERRRLRGKPGITCLWQISGRADLPFDRQVVLDVAYLKSRTIWLDLWILLRTPIAVLTARGAY